MNGFSYKQVAIGIFLALFALLFGEMLGMSFGAKEAEIKAGYKARAEAAAAHHGSPEKVAKASEKGWKYLKRSHEHFMGLGAVAVALCLLIGHARVKPIFKTVASTAVGLGALLYPAFWYLVSFKTASLGASEAKESLAFIAQAGASLGFLGLGATIVICVLWLLAKEEKGA